MDHPEERKDREPRCTGGDEGPEQDGDCKAEVPDPDSEKTGAQSWVSPLTRRTHRGAGTGPGSKSCDGESAKTREAESG